MITQSGRDVWPEFGAPSLDDIAIGLGRICRFAGQTKHWYSVLDHTFVVVDLVAPEYRIHALLHDAPEAVVSDVPSTWKSRAAERNEKLLLERIYREHDLAWPSFAARKAVKAADLLALAAEAHVLGHSAAEKYWPTADVDERAIIATKMRLLASYGSPWQPSDAAAAFAIQFAAAMLAAPGRAVVAS